MSKVLIGVILVLSLVTYYFYSQNQILVANNSQLENAVATQEEAIKSIQADFELQTQQLQELSVKSQKAQRELNRYTQMPRPTSILLDTMVQNGKILVLVKT